MKEPTRIALNVFAYASALVAFAVAVLWAFSFRNDFAAEFNHRGELCKAWVKAGVVGVDNAPAIEIAKFREQRDLFIANGQFGGKGLIVPPPAQMPARWSHSSVLALPVVVVMFAITPVLLLARVRRSRMRRNDL